MTVVVQEVVEEEAEGRRRKRNDTEKKNGVRLRQGDVGAVHPSRASPGGRGRSKVVNECVDSGVRQSRGPSGK